MPDKKIAHVVPQPPVIETRHIVAVFFPYRGDNFPPHETFNLDMDRGDRIEEREDGTLVLTITEKLQGRAAVITIRPSYLWVERFDATVKVKTPATGSGEAPQLLH